MKLLFGYFTTTLCFFSGRCLEKNPENRPYAQELLEHPFFETLAENETKV